MQSFEHAAGRTGEEKAIKSEGSLDEQIRELTVPIIGSEPWQLPTNASSSGPFNIFEVTTINANAPNLTCTETWVRINDDALRNKFDNLLEKIWPGEISLDQNPIDAKRLYHFMAGLIEHCKHEDDKNSSVSCSLRLLVHWATLFKSKIEAKVQEIRSTKFVEYKYLWAVFEPGEIMVMNNFHGMKDLTVCAKLIGFEELIDGNERMLRLTLQTINTTSSDYGYQNLRFSITSFVGKQQICDLGLYPLSYHTDSQELVKRLVSRGRKFVQLTHGNGFHHRQYEGKVIIDDQDGTLDWKDERIMVDCCALNKKRPLPAVPRITRGLRSSWLDPDKLTDEELLICSGTVPALNLSEGRIGTVAIDCLRPVEWRDISVAKNVTLADDTEAKMKTIMKIAKPVFGQEQSTVIVFYGTSNLGKKWTVEVIAEEFKCAILTVSPFSRPQGSPAKWAYELCNRWGAIMHVQEPIVVTGRGSELPPSSSGRESFLTDLRTLESVVCIITTSYDELAHPDLWKSATLGLKFEKPKAMGAIWSNALAKAGVKLSDKAINSLAKDTDTASQINSMVNLARRLAEHEGRKPGLEDFAKARELRKENLPDTEDGQNLDHYF